MCLGVDMSMWLQVLEALRGIGSPEDVVTGVCEMLEMDAENWTLVLCKGNKCS